MISIDQARQLIAEQAFQLEAEEVTLEQAMGRIIREDVFSDIDSPPHTKSLVDGYAVIASDTQNPTAPCRLKVLEEITAGKNPTQPIIAGTASAVMTGAPIPAGADAMAMVEQTELSDDGSSVLIHEQLQPGARILPQGVALQKGQQVLPAGRLIKSALVGLLAEVGRSKLLVSKQPRIAVATTGNELVPVHETPAKGYIRNSNGPMLHALALQGGALPTSLGVLADNEAELEQGVIEGLKHDVFVLTGGVSAGVLDLTPAVFAKCGVKAVFHKIRMKPGKPLWFGVAENAGKRTLVFGLPGNPVSSLVCFHVFVQFALSLLMGRPPLPLTNRQSRLLSDSYSSGDRDTFWPALVTNDGVELLSWKGSADLYTLARANCLAYLPADQKWMAGDAVAILDFGDR
ncbi:MAG: molybdopterin molybdotransferase MoeA [bacterium]|nr:molybdopterin molybdotransferase MoeA [bacterium]